MKQMNRKALMLIIVLAVFSCSKSPEEKAMLMLEKARAAFEQDDLQTARAGIDSLRKNYPTVIEARKGALKLHQDIELKAAQDELAETDSLLILANRELEALQQQVDSHKAAMKATATELTQLTRTRMHRDSIRTQYEVQGAKIRFIRQKQKEII